MTPPGCGPISAKRHVSQSWGGDEPPRRYGVTREAVDSPRLRGRGRKGVSPPLGCRGQGALALLRNGNTAREAGRRFYRPEIQTPRRNPPILATGNGTLEMTPLAAADPPLRNGMSANRGVAMRGSEGRSRLAGARSAALEALIATPHHNGAVAVGRSPSDRGCAGPPRRGRLFVG